MLQFHNAEDAKKALEQLNGFELAGRPMKVGHVTERQGLEAAAGMVGNSVFDTDDMDRQGIDLGATGRLQLMAKLAEGKGANTDWAWFLTILLTQLCMHSAY